MSPRGTRAVHGAEVNGSVHAHGHGAVAVAMPDGQWLGVTCWCERTYVAVPQYDVRWSSETRSCGRAQCHPTGWRPGDPLQVGVELSASQLPRVDNVIGRSAARPRVVTLLPASRLDDANAFDVAVRRETVLELWRQGKGADDIGLAIGAKPYIVRNDLNWLRSRGRLAAAS